MENSGRTAVLGGREKVQNTLVKMPAVCHLLLLQLGILGRTAVTIGCKISFFFFLRISCQGRLKIRMMVISLDVLGTGTELSEGCLSVLSPNQYYILANRKQYI